jgi:two-component system chemotaxis sensor kinase CheA
MNELLAQFVIEARELLEEAAADLLALERAPDDEGAINRVFRSVHTLKGSSGLFDARPLTEVLHAAEDIFQAVREHTLALRPEMVDLALKALDQVGLWIDQLELHEVLAPGAPKIAKVLAGDLRAQFPKPGAANPVATGAAAPAPAAPVASGAGRWFDAATLLAAAEAAEPGGASLISYLPEGTCFFRGEDPLYLMLQIPQLQAFVIEPPASVAPLAELDPFNCDLRLYALSAADPAELEALFRYVPEQVTIQPVGAADLPATAGVATPKLAESGVAASGSPASGGGLPALVQALLREQIDMLALDAPEEEQAGRIAAAAAVATNALRFCGEVEAAVRIAAAVAAAPAEQRRETLCEAIAGLVEPVAPQADEPGPATGPAPAARAAPADAAEQAAPRTLRVEQSKVDALMTLIGELVVAKNSLPFLARRAALQYGLRDFGREISDQYGTIDRIAQELRGAVMAVRMMPVGQVFQRFPRLVRDLARKLGKEVELVIEGGETQADKNVIETLFDPLLHMVRNSLDHGIETPETRTASGKPATATVRLIARHEADRVEIDVIDDGRGIDPEAIKRKAYERGVIDQTRFATISDDDATMLVFAAGLSTAETISDVSGRGVGMDVVRNAVEKAGGRISISSVLGKGTTVRLNLPLSMAVSRVMTVALGERLFGVPMDLIHATVKVPRGDVVSIRGKLAFVLRERVVPVVDLAGLLDLPDAAFDKAGSTAGASAGDADEVAVLVVSVGGETIGLAVSAFGEGMEVILKPLEGVLAGIDGYIGTALLGDGRVLLVLDLKELIQ